MNTLTASDENAVASNAPHEPAAGPADAAYAHVTPSVATDREPAWRGKPITHANLVLEGGAMRAMFTAGVLDFFMDHDLWCNHVFGTSAGALGGYSYVAGEIGRMCYLNTKYCDDPRYLSLASFVRTGNAFGAEFSFREIPNELDPFNFEAFNTSPMDLTCVSSNLETGEADYHLMRTGDDPADLAYLQATSAMPLVSQIVEVDGKKLLDGGSCDSVPLLYAMMQGHNTKHIVVLTRQPGFERSPNKIVPLARRIYADYPYFVDRIEYRHFEYNRLYRWIRALHDEGKVFMLQPQKPVEVKPMESDPAKLFDLYEQGLEEAARQWGALQAYLEKE